MKSLFYALLLLLPGLCHAQGDQTIITVPITASGTTTFQAILHLPDDYATSSTKYPLLMFFHGSGEGGANPATIYTSSTAGGPAYFIAQGEFPTSFVNPKDGQSYKFIVVSPQANPEGIQMSTTAQELDYILTYLYAHYRIDTNRLYLTGLSDGGETCVEYPGGVMSNGGNELRFTRTHRIAAILPMSENGIANLIPEQADTITGENIGFWGFGSTDTQGQNTLQLAWYCNQDKANSAITTSYSGGHCCWGQFYNPTFTQNGMSMYQWMLQFTSGNSGTQPVANGGAAQTITLPTTQATLNGSGSSVQGGTIAKYAWSQQSGPSKAVISSPSSVTTAVTGLTTPGTNVFALQITDNTGKTSTATTQITVNASATTVTLPGTVEGENFASMSGVSTQPTTDAGGGNNVDYIDNGDWMNYNVNVSAAGTYTVGFRVASPNSGASLQLRNSSGAVLATVAVPNTGGFQTWTTVTASVTLPAGAQTLQVYSNASPEWNFNWMQFSGTSTAVAIPGTVQAENYTSMNNVATQATTDAGGGSNVDYIQAGSWMQYAVNAASAGTYTIGFRVATVNSGCSFQVRSSTGAILATVTVPNTGGWQTWTTVNASVTLPAGNQTLQVYCNAGPVWNLNWMQFNISSTAVAIPGTVQAENYTSMNNVATQTTTDAGGGSNVDYIQEGSWMQYAVNAASAGTYTIGFRVATVNSGCSFQLKDGNGNVLATVPVPNTGGWQTWTTVSAVVTLPAGAQNLQVYSTGSTVWNLNWLQFTAGGSSTNIPGTVQAESYSGMSGVQTQATTDAGGGLNVDYIQNGDWMNYNVNAASAGTYTVGFRVASINSGGSFQLRSSTGAVLASVTVPNTGGWQTWTTVNASVALPAGSQTLQVYCNAAPIWNLNWMQFSTTASAADDTSFTVAADSTFLLYPNPVRSNFTLNITNGHTGNTVVRVLDLSGNTRQVLTAFKDQQQLMLNVNASELPVGMYFVQVQIGAWRVVKKIVKD